MKGKTYLKKEGKREKGREWLFVSANTCRLGT